MRNLLLAAVSAAAWLASPAAVAQHASIKVQLFADVMPSSVAVIPETGSLTLLADPLQEPLSSISQPDTVFVRRGAIDLRTKAGDLQINLTDLYIEVPAPDAFIVEIVRSDGQVTARRFTGTLHVSNDAGRGRLRIVNEVDLETYVAAVVGKEYDLDDGEGARAMAIVARTFAAHASREGDGTATDGLASQVYRGLDAITDASRAAANSTRGKILTYDDAPIVAVYSASNGGHSASNADVWSGEPLPYLRAKRDRYDSKASPHREWTLQAPVREIHALLEPKTGGTVENVSISDRTRDGRVRTVTVKTNDGRKEELSGNDFRLTVSRKYGASSLRSTRFDMKKRGDEYEFKGSGFGHGVGLSQWGAHEMSNRGYNHEEILRHYYPGTKLSTIGSLTDAPVPAFAAELRPAAPASDTDSEDRLADLESGQSPRLVSWTGMASGSRPTATLARRRLGW